MQKTEETYMQDKCEQGNIKFPKRRKSKDNPYTIEYDENHQSYFLSFLDGNEIRQHIYISQKLYDVFNAFELEDISQMNEQERHIGTKELTEEFLYKKLSYQSNLVEEEVEKRTIQNLLSEAIKGLNPTQRRRLILYYFQGFTYEQIAQIEGCSTRAIKYSVDCAKNNLKKSLKKFWI